MSEQEDHREHKIDKEAQSFCCPGECAVPPSVVATEEHGRNISPLGNAGLHHVETDCTWAALGGLVGPLGTTAKPPQTKSGGNNPDTWLSLLESCVWRCGVYMNHTKLTFFIKVIFILHSSAFWPKFLKILQDCIKLRKYWHNWRHYILSNDSAITCSFGGCFQNLYFYQFPCGLCRDESNIQ